jgi:nucleotide-binding universal stress UspA family protein
VLATRRLLADLAADLGVRHGIEAFAESATGSAADEIARLTRATGARLLVIGKQGENWIADAVLGETALKLVKGTEVPVLVARDKPRRQMQHILIATDYSDNALRAARAAHDLFPQADKRLLNAYTVTFEGRMRLAGASDDDIENYRAIERARAEQGMRSFVAKLDADDSFATTVTHGFPASAVLEAAALDVDLVVVGRHSGSAASERLLGSVTRNVLYHAVCDVLLVP